MRRLLPFIIIISLIITLSACSNPNSEIDDLKAQIQQLKSSINKSEGAQSETKSTSATTTAPSVSEKTATGQSIMIGETIQVPNVCEITVNAVEFSSVVKPPKPDTLYSYYEVKDTGNTYLHLVLVYKNLEGTAKNADDAADVTVLYDKKYEYTSFSTIEEDGGSDFTYTNITSIGPLKIGNLHFLCEVPLEVRDSGKSVEATVIINDNKYVIKVK